MEMGVGLRKMGLGDVRWGGVEWRGAGQGGVAQAATQCSGVRWGRGGDAGSGGVLDGTGTWSMAELMAEWTAELMPKLMAKLIGDGRVDS